MNTQGGRKHFGDDKPTSRKSSRLIVCECCKEKRTPKNSRLCLECWSIPANRKKYPVRYSAKSGRKKGSHKQLEKEPEIPPKQELGPQIRPGTYEKLVLMRKRLLKGLPLSSPSDHQDTDDSPGVVVGSNHLDFNFDELES